MGDSRPNAQALLLLVLAIPGGNICPAKSMVETPTIMKMTIITLIMSKIEGARAIAEMLRRNTTLTTLNLSNNVIDYEVRFYPSLIELKRDKSYGYATEYKKSVHAKCFLKSWYFRGHGPGYGMLFRLFYAIQSYSPVFSDQNVSSISYSRDF